jgi:predicted ATP-grasp superfamily ATP-dependent carboligase
VVGLDSTTGLQTARLLARRGIPVWGITNSLSHFAARTRVCKEVLRANTASDELLELLEGMADRFPVKPVLYPCSDNSVLRISLGRTRLQERYHFAVPHHDVIAMLTSKATLARHAREHGFRVPVTVDVRSHHDLELAISKLRFPCVLKPALKDLRWVSLSSDKAFKAYTPMDLVSAFDKCSHLSDHFVVQEWIEGPESDQYTCNCYFNRDSQPLATFVTRKIRQWPPDTGVATLAVECRNDSVRDETIRLFQSVRYWGLGYAEMKLDRRTGELFLIEPNVGRPTGRSAMAEAGGVELLYCMYCDVTGLPLPAELTQDYQPRKWIYLRQDLQAASLQWWRGELPLAEWLRSLRGPKTYAVLSTSDPWPFVVDWLRYVGVGRARPRMPSQRTRSVAAGPL